MSSPSIYGALLAAGEPLAQGHRYLVHVGTARAFGGEAWREYLEGRDWEAEGTPVALTSSLYAFYARNLRDRAARDGAAAAAMAATVSNNLGVDPGAVLIYDPGAEQTFGERVIDRAVAPLEAAGAAAAAATQHVVGAAEDGARRIVGATEAALAEVREQARDVGSSGQGALRTFAELGTAAKWIAIGVPVTLAGVAAIALAWAYWPRKGKK